MSHIMWGENPTSKTKAALGAGNKRATACLKKVFDFDLTLFFHCGHVTKQGLSWNKSKAVNDAIFCGPQRQV